MTRKRVPPLSEDLQEVLCATSPTIVKNKGKCWKSTTFALGKMRAARDRHDPDGHVDRLKHIASTSPPSSSGPVLSIISTDTRCLHIALRTEFCRTMLRSSTCFLVKCFQMPFSWETRKMVLRATSHLSIHFCSRISSLFFLLSRIVYTTSPRLCEY